MTLRRTQQESGWVNPNHLPKGPNGRNLCRRCGKEVPPDRRTFCSDTCVHQWRLRTQPRYVRQCVWARDHGVCAVCRLDTQAGRPYRGIARMGSTGHLWQADHIVAVVEGGGECGLDGYRTLCTVCHRRETAALAARRAAARKECR